MKIAVLIIGILIGLLLFSLLKNQFPGKKFLRHVVLFKFKDGTRPEKTKELEDAFRGLPAKIAQIKKIEWGLNSSPENLSQGFTHCFFVTFNTDSDRDSYLVHPAHKEFGKLLKPILDKVLVLDYWANK